MRAYSLLDLAPIPEGATAADALRNSLDLARLAEETGYRRFWRAEHHNMPGIASAATAVVIGHVAAGTKTIRVGAGGGMLPNHAPLVIAEQFGTLAALFPGRIDLGLGRAPGTDMLTARALRRHLAGPEDFPADVAELIGYLGAPQEGARIRAVPGEGTNVPVWILGSSLYGAEFAAHFGLPYAFASHFAPFALEEALTLYRARFRPSAHLAKPYAIMAVGAALAETDEEARYLRSSQILGFANLRMGRPGPLPRPVEDLSAHLPPEAIAQAEAAFSCAAVGSPATARRRFAELAARYRPDEIMVTGMIHDHALRLRSFALAAEALAGLVDEAAAA